MCDNNCSNCRKKLVATGVVIDGTSPNESVVYTAPDVDLENLDKFCLIFAQSLPLSSNTLPIRVSINGKEIIVQTRSGNFFRADQLKNRKRYPVVYGNDPIHLSLQCLVPNTCYTELP